MSLAISSWIERGETSTFSGATGLGKTWLACALAQYACRQGHSALYLHVPRLAEELRILHGAGSFWRWLTQLAKTDVLVLDDWGTGAIDAATRADLLEIIDDRSAQRATIITHQLPIEHWHAWLGDPTVADAILDRLMQHCRRFSLEGEPRRTGNAARTGGKLQETAKEGEKPTPKRQRNPKLRPLRSAADRPAVMFTETAGHVAGTPFRMSDFAVGHVRRNGRSPSPKCAFGEWGKVFQDPAMTLAAVCRLVHHSTIFEMNVGATGAAPPLNASKSAPVDRRATRHRKTSACRWCPDGYIQAQVCFTLRLWRDHDALVRSDPANAAIGSRQSLRLEGSSVRNASSPAEAAKSAMTFESGRCRVRCDRRLSLQIGKVYV